MECFCEVLQVQKEQQTSGAEQQQEHEDVRQPHGGQAQTPSALVYHLTVHGLLSMALNLEPTNAHTKTHKHEHFPLNSQEM